MFNNNNNLKRSVGDLERFAFDNFDSFDPEMYDAGSAETPGYYDDEETFDPEMYDLPNGYNGKQSKRSRIKNAPLGQLDIVIDNTNIAAVTTVELFNVLRSNTLIRNTTYNTTTFEPQTLDKTKNRAAANADYMSDAQMIYWRSDGSLVYNTTVGTAGSPGSMGTAACIISCPQVPFRVLHEATRQNLLWIEKIRLVVPSATLTQIDQPFTVFKNTFLGGRKENQIAPRSEFKPNQFQSNIVDVPFKTAIDAETGISYALVSQSKVTLSMFFRFIRGNEYMVHDGF